ncbi:SIS domain-containing protein [Holdemania massiliensis]|uniref:SIS domain-containing protein n=1 Tax=Holdemania massiliensis TaxID=1468449 RepID=UPI002675EB74|nr:SIS domain-containing protein [Holdemania massiliensis]
MKEITMDLFYEEMLKVVDVLEGKEMDNIRKASEVCAETIAQGGVVHVFGSGHSVGFGMELAGRPGSLVPFHTIVTSDFVLHGKVTLAEFKDPDNIFERRADIADRLYDLYDIRPQDSFIIISNSGINGVVIDFAIKAKAEGHKVIVVTSWQHTSAEASRHPSGKKLYEMGDVVIDNCGPQGDALIETGKIEKICSISSITGAFIAQSITTETCRLLSEKGVELPLLLSEETEENRSHNAELRQKYAGRI